MDSLSPLASLSSSDVVHEVGVRVNDQGITEAFQTVAPPKPFDPKDLTEGQRDALDMAVHQMNHETHREIEAAQAAARAKALGVSGNVLTPDAFLIPKGEPGEPEKPETFEQYKARVEAAEPGQAMFGKPLSDEALTEILRSMRVTQTERHHGKPNVLVTGLGREEGSSSLMRICPACGWAHSKMTDCLVCRNRALSDRVAVLEQQNAEYHMTLELANAALDDADRQMVARAREAEDPRIVSVGKRDLTAPDHKKPSDMLPFAAIKAGLAIERVLAGKDKTKVQGALEAIEWLELNGLKIQLDWSLDDNCWVINYGKIAWTCDAEQGGLIGAVQDILSRTRAGRVLP